MEIAAKLHDALSMFWQTLDERERSTVLFLAAYVVVVCVAAVTRRAADERERRLRDSILDELRGATVNGGGG